MPRSKATSKSGAPVLKSVGAVVVLVSALSLVIGSGAFSVIDADRGAAVAVADDENAYLEIVDNTTDETLRVDDADGAAVFLLTDRTGEFGIGDVDSTFVRFGTDESVDLTASVRDSDAGADHDWEVVLECGSEATHTGVDTVTVDVTASGSLSISAPDRTTAGSVDVECGSS